MNLLGSAGPSHRRAHRIGREWETKVANWPAVKALRRCTRCIYIMDSREVKPRHGLSHRAEGGWPLAASPGVSVSICDLPIGRLGVTPGPTRPLSSPRWCTAGQPA